MFDIQDDFHDDRCVKIEYDWQLFTFLQREVLPGCEDVSHLTVIPEKT